MTFIPLQGGAYQSRSVIASAQRCLNLYPEVTNQSTGEPFRVTHYPTPGSTMLHQAPFPVIRCLYQATTGNLYAISYNYVFYIDQTWNWNFLGILDHTQPSDIVQRFTPVSMSDNGSVLVIVDGTSDGWFIDLTQPFGFQAVQHINTAISPGFYGSTFIAFQDSFFLLSKPDTNIFYISGSNINAQSFLAAFTVLASTIVSGGAGSNAGYSAGDILTLVDTGSTSDTSAEITVSTVDNQGGITGYNVTFGGNVITQPINPVGVTGGTGVGASFTLIYGPGSGAFDPLDFASKTALTDPLVATISVHRSLWLIGEKSFEIWINTGGGGTITTSFPFNIYPGAFGNWGCCAKYSVCTQMNKIYWLSEDASGRGMIMKGEGIAAERISTHAIETQIAKYPRIDDCIGMCYTQEGHQFALFTFPSANSSRGATWCYDAVTNEWHERAWIDNNGIEYRHRANCMTEAYGTNVFGDWETNGFYMFDLNNYTDDGQSIKRLRSFPHQIDVQGPNRRVFYKQLVAQMAVGGLDEDGPSRVIAETSFVGPPDPVELSQFYFYKDINGGFTQVNTPPNPFPSPNYIEVQNNAAICTGGPAEYKSNAVPATSDYIVSFTFIPENYGFIPTPGNTVYVIGRADGSNNGYKMSVGSDGGQYILTLDNMIGNAITVGLGSLSGQYYEVILEMQSTSIQAFAYRTIDGNWLGPQGWQGSPGTAITMIDSTYTLPGRVLTGGNLVA